MKTTLLILASLPLMAQTRALEPGKPVSFSTLRDLVTLCESRIDAEAAMCRSYIYGFIGSLLWLTDYPLFLVNPDNFTKEARGMGICIDRSFMDTHKGYVQGHVVAYGHQHPDRLDYDPEPEMMQILKKAFPCK